MKKYILILILLSTKLTFGQLNGDFENWDTTFTHYYYTDLITQFNVQNPENGNIKNWKNLFYGWGVGRTTDSYINSYAVLINNWYSYANDGIIYNDSISFKPQYLQGYFKYITGGIHGLGAGSIKVYLTKINGSKNDTIGYGMYNFDSASHYKTFQVNINYTSTSLPDSINIIIKNAEYGCKGNNLICHLLYLDDLKLSNIPLNIDQEINDNIFSIYPNPLQSNQTLSLQLNKSTENTTIKIINAISQIIYQKNINRISDNSIITLYDIHLPTGIYIISLETENSSSTQKLIITE